MKRTRLKSANLERRAEMRARNFPDRPVVAPWCLVAIALERYQARHGAKQVPRGSMFIPPATVNSRAGFTVYRA